MDARELKRQQTVANVADLLPTWATFVLTALPLLSIIAFCRVTHVLLREDVVWLLEDTTKPSTRQPENGRYCDARCNQLTCRPTESPFAESSKMGANQKRLLAAKMTTANEMFI
eukprot:s50_g3.t3